MNPNDYETWVRLAHTWGLVLAVIIFGCALAYALWPGRHFDKVARTPLEADDE